MNVTEVAKQLSGLRQVFYGDQADSLRAMVELRAELVRILPESLEHLAAEVAVIPVPRALSI